MYDLIIKMYLSKNYGVVFCNLLLDFILDFNVEEKVCWNFWSLMMESWMVIDYFIMDIIGIY